MVVWWAGRACESSDGDLGKNGNNGAMIASCRCCCLVVLVLISAIISSSSSCFANNSRCRERV